jgi:uncharacterized membrane protein YgaE (UPF0421/DUF939 family)
MENYQELILLIIGAGVGYITPILVKFLKGLLDKLETKVNETENKIDDELYKRLREIVEEVLTKEPKK